ncbi:MAG: (Fe-S)-binding protein [Gemmatimonas sp.]
MRSVALFVPCYVDQFYPRAAIAALQVLERLHIEVVVPASAACCGQPLANAGYERRGTRALDTFIDTFASYDRIVVLSGSCAMHVRTHAGEHNADGAVVASRTTEFCAFLHDEVGLPAVATLSSTCDMRIGLHIGCHGLRGLGLARASELQVPGFNKVRALLQTVRGVTFADLQRPDECCGFGGTFSVTEPAISAKMGRDRLRDYAADAAQAIVSTDMSCLMHLDGLARRDGVSLPMMHVAEVLNGGIAA